MENSKFLTSYAIFDFGGKQYQAVAGTTLAVEKIDAEPGSNVNFERVLLVKNSEESVIIGKPFVDGAVVEAEIVSHIKGPKLIAFRFFRRKRIRVKKGHRQNLTVVRFKNFKS